MKLLTAIYYTFFIVACASTPDTNSSTDEVLDQTKIEHDPKPTDEFCTVDEKRSCHVTLGVHEEVVSCFVGIQTCIDGKWSECNNGNEIKKTSNDNGKPLSLTEEKICENNPCDVRCSKWVEDGKWKADGSVCKWKWSWSAAPADNIKKANDNGAAETPCTDGSDCQQNQKCQDPAQGSCSHDICTKGDGLVKGCEADCVDKICELKPQCCEKKYEGTCETEPCLTYDKGLTKDCDPSVTKVCDWDKTCCPYTEWDVCSYWDIVDYQTVCEWVDTYVCGWSETYTCGWRDVENYSCGWHWVNVYYCGWHWTWVQVYLCGWHWTYVYTYYCGWRWIETYICGWRWRYVYTYICGWRWRYVYTYVCGWYYVYTYICGWRWRYIYTYICGWRWKTVYLCGWRWRYVYTYFCGWRWRQTYICGWRWTWIQNYVCGWTWTYNYYCDWWSCWWQEDYVYTCWWEQQYVYTYECWWEQEYVYECWWEDVYTYLYECWWEEQYVYECWWEDVYTYLYECWWENVYTYGCWWEDVYTYLYECWWEDVYTYLYECWWEQQYVYDCWWENVYTYLYECWWDQQYVYIYECWWDQEYRYDCGWYWETIYDCWWEQIYECWWELQENCWDDPIYGWIYYDCEKSYDGLWDQHCVDQYKEYDPGQCPMSWKGDWDTTCINAVHDTCHDYCDGVNKGAGACVEWEAPNYDEKCDTYELGVGLTCKGSTPIIPICNTGAQEAPKGIPIAIMPKGSGYFAGDHSMLSNAKYCYTDEAIPAGECRNVTTCDVADGEEVVVNPSANANYLKDECYDKDNWGFFYGDVCGYPPKCPGGYLDTTKVESYESTCDEEQTPQWGFLSWDATTPVGAEISFRIRTAQTKADLPNASWASVSMKSTNTSQDCSASGPSPCPVDLYILLSKIDAQKKFLELETNFKVDVDKKNTATLEKWEISYSCIEEQ